MAWKARLLESFLLALLGDFFKEIKSRGYPRRFSDFLFSCAFLQFCFWYRLSPNPFFFLSYVFIFGDGGSVRRLL